MEQKLLLTSQGIQPGLRDVFLSLIKKPSETTVAFVTTAAFGEENPTWLDIYRNQLRDCGIKDIADLDFKGKKEEQLRQALLGKDVIFVNGGNAFYLLQQVKKSGFDKILPGLLEKGVLYVGVSAGSYIACPNIEHAAWKHGDRNDNVRLKDLTALNLVPFYITAHFVEAYRSVVNEASHNTELPIVALYDTQAILVRGKNYEVVGKGPREFFNNFAESKTRS